MAEPAKRRKRPQGRVLSVLASDHEIPLDTVFHQWKCALHSSSMFVRFDVTLDHHMMCELINLTRKLIDKFDCPVKMT